jgi:hypothetical protein
LTEYFIARQQLIEWHKLARSAPRDPSTHVFVDKRFEPIPQCTSLCRNGIEFTGKSSLWKTDQYAFWYQASALEAREKILPRDKPLDLGIHWDCYGVQEGQS